MLAEMLSGKPLFPGRDCACAPPRPPRRSSTRADPPAPSQSQTITSCRSSWISSARRRSTTFTRSPRSGRASTSARCRSGRRSRSARCSRPRTRWCVPLRPRGAVLFSPAAHARSRAARACAAAATAASNGARTLQAIDLMEKCLTFSPKRRIEVDEALKHPYLEVSAPVPSSPAPRSVGGPSARRRPSETRPGGRMHAPTG